MTSTKNYNNPLNIHNKGGNNYDILINTHIYYDKGYTIVDHVNDNSYDFPCDSHLDNNIEYSHEQPRA
ncbi:hypothetical protein PFDG_05288 [Plasmodium falciparum Dd2]|uniref:Uncharacterized protein n=1 Tax=Plasmodium falciparum (isolate Dd2) TaxID=57267 RepID=A0A0L7MA87_PLAF4|nr:hypothetical protein PFDG_05288 [Plasmodium falciparum Dd2]